MMDQTPTSAQQLGSLLLDTGILMLRSGASSNRIGIVVKRIATTYGFVPHMNIGPKSVALLLESEKDKKAFDGMRSTMDYGVNFTILSGISMMSWSITERNWSPEEMKAELRRLEDAPHYSRWLVLIAVALSGAGFCFTFGGDALEMGVTFLATFCGLFTKQELIKRSFNTYVCTFMSALVAALITRLVYRSGFDLPMEHAYATCVLFLIPGVHLINFFIDLVAGNILYGLERGTNALIHTLAIALGLATVLSLNYF